MKCCTNLRSKLREAMGLEPNEYDVSFRNRVDLVRCGGVGMEIAAGTDDVYALVLHGPKVFASRDQGHVTTAPRESGAYVCADRPGANDRNLHLADSDSA